MLISPVICKTLEKEGIEGCEGCVCSVNSMAVEVAPATLISVMICVTLDVSMMGDAVPVITQVQLAGWPRL
jgi:hypothetical protein